MFTEDISLSSFMSSVCEAGYIQRTGFADVLSIGKKRSLGLSLCAVTKDSDLGEFVQIV